MKQSELLRTAKDALQDQMGRLESLRPRFTEETINRKRHADEYSVAQILEHLILSDDVYFEPMRNKLSAARSIQDDPEVRFSFIGKFLMKVAGPSGNAPVPKPFRPKDKIYSLDVVDSFLECQRQAIELTNISEGKDLNGSTLPNPVFKLFKMNLADCIGIMYLHTERHIRQIEERI